MLFYTCSIPRAVINLEECSHLDVHFFYVKRDINSQSFCLLLRNMALNPSSNGVKVYDSDKLPRPGTIKATLDYLLLRYFVDLSAMSAKCSGNSIFRNTFTKTKHKVTTGSAAQSSIELLLTPIQAFIGIWWYIYISGI